MSLKRSIEVTSSGTRQRFCVPTLWQRRGKEKQTLRKEILFKATEGFGAGMGTLDGVCGALTGGLLIAGLKNSTGNLDTPKSKASTMKISKAMLTSFRDKCGALICRELKGVDSGKMLCSCPDCIKHGVEVVEKAMSN